MSSKNNKVMINGVIVDGDCVHGVIISNGRVIINGKDTTPESKNITIEITGDVGDISIDCCSTLTVNGNAKFVKTASGNIYCNDVEGDVKSMSGNITCDDIGGRASTMSGNITMKGKKQG